MNNKIIDVRAFIKHYLGDYVHICVIQKDLASGKKEAFSGGMWYDMKERYVDVPIAFTLEAPEAQTLMDDLWRCGIRPTEGKGSAGQLEATKLHLNDMRKIASSCLEINL